MNIVILSPQTPPQKCGVGDHTMLLIKKAQEMGWRVNLWSSSSATSKHLEGIQREDSITYSSVPSDLTEYKNRIPQMIQNNIKGIIIQWVPHLYHPKGIDINISLWLRFLKLNNIIIGTYIHELAIPWLPIKNIPAAILQHTNARYIVKMSDVCWISTTSWYKTLSKIKAPNNQIQRKIYYAPVGSTLQPIPELKCYPGPPWHIVCFSPQGSGKNLDLLNELIRYFENNTSITWTIIGNCKKEVRETLLKQCKKIKRIMFTGFIHESKVSELMWGSHIGVCPFVDGISGRRTSAWAMLQHGLATISNIGKNCDPSAFEESGITLTDGSFSGFAQAIEQLTLDPTLLKKKSLISREYYEKKISISTQVVLSQMLASLENTK